MEQRPEPESECPEAEPQPNLAANLHLEVRDDEGERYSLLMGCENGGRGLSPVSADTRYLLRLILLFALEQTGALFAKNGDPPPWPHDRESERSWQDCILGVIAELGV